MTNNIPLTALRVFEATARLGSFRAAADELHLSASAVSHAIAKLERILGTVLYERTTRSITLTQAGQTLSVHVARAFEDIRIGLSQVASNQPRLLRVHCAPSFAARILTPKLADFIDKNPSTEVRIAASTAYARFFDDVYDVDIVYGEIAAHDGLVTIPLGQEKLVPLCTPEVARSIHSPRDILKQRLIQSTSKRLGWADWCAKHGLGDAPQPYMSFDRSFLAIDAACHGMGIALECTRFAEDELRDGRLVCPLDMERFALIYNGHYLAYPKSSGKRNLIRNFTDWLLVELSSYA